MWQAEADTEWTLSASPTTAVGKKALALAKRRYFTVWKTDTEYTDVIETLISLYKVLHKAKFCTLKVSSARGKTFL